MHTYDVGVIMLEHAARAKPRAVVAACTARQGLVAGATVKLVGFGLTTRTGTGNNTRLHEAQIPVIDPACTDDPACNPEVSPGGELTAGGDGPDACFGDSGGPIYLDTAAGPALVGVVSRASAMTDRPCGGGGVYVRADKVVPWIQRVTHETVGRTRCSGAADDDPATAATGPGDERLARGGCAACGGAGGTLVIALGAITLVSLYRRRRLAVQSAS
jgi:secreted trypsin-like serine protease